MSFQRSFAQRNNNLSQIVPEFATILSETNISGCSLYVLNVPKRGTPQNYYVDLNSFDSCGNLINVDGLFYPFVPSGNELEPINIVSFILNIDISASSVPGHEFTIFFKNLPFDRLTGVPLLTLGLVSSMEIMGPPLPYILSPPFPPLMGSNISPSITLKSDGANFNVVTSGPAGWLGVPALSVILGAYDGFFSP
jgi:hypothetical protein